MNRKAVHEEHENGERWLLTYSDLITLLLGLFVILYASSQVDSGKFQQLMNAFENMFGTTGEGGGGIMPNKGGLPIPMVGSNGRSLVEIGRQITAAMQAARIKNNPNTPDNSTAGNIMINERGLTVHLEEELLFETGRADLKKSSLDLLDTIAIIIADMPNELRMEGHTDNVPINTAQFPSNWHLSVARAMTTAYYLMERHHLRPEKISVVGYGEYRPIADNTSSEGRSKNRRVDLVILETELGGDKMIPRSMSQQLSKEQQK